MRRLSGCALAAVGITLAVHAAAQSGDRRLVSAMANRDLATVRSLVSEGVGIDVPDAESATALHWAAHWNDMEAVRLLLDAGADPNARNRFDVTPLHLAAIQGNPALVAALLGAGADPNAAFGDGETALMTASRTGNPAVVSTMLEHGGDPNAVEGWHGQTALMWAAQENHAEVVMLLIGAGADVNRASTAHDWVEIVYSAGNVPKTRDVGGLTPLHFAARHGSVDAAQVLLDAGADATSQEPMYGLTPLQVAVVNGHYRLARHLIDHGVAVNDGSLYLAIDTRNLAYYAQRPNPPEKDGDVSNLEVIERLLERGADPDLPYTKGIPERTVAGQIEVPAGATPLDRAASAADFDVVRLLINHGADGSVKADDGVTPLMLLAGFKRGRAGPEMDDSPERNETVRMLLEAGAEPALEHPETGKSAVQYAEEAGAAGLVELMRRYGSIPAASTAALPPDGN